jgi:hypothetical protein
MSELKVFTNIAFEGHYPVGVAAIIIAKDKHDAARLLSNALFDAHLDPNVTEENMIEVNSDEEQALILCDGNY